MEIDAEMRRKIGASLLATLVFVVLVVVVGLQYSDEAPEGGVVLTHPGGTVFVAAIAVFILIMAGIGVYLDRQ